MSKNVKRFLPIAAAIAIPFVAGPLGVALSSSMLLSGTALGTFLASTGGAAVLGGLMGAGVGAISGGGLKGALIGGATGALGGFAGAGGLSGLGGLGEVASVTAGTPSAAAPATGSLAAAPSISLAPAAAGVAPAAAGAGAVPVVTGIDLAGGIAGQLTGAAATAAPVGGLTNIPASVGGLTNIPAFSAADLTTSATNIPTLTGGPSGGTGVSRMLAGLGKAENLMPLMQTGMQFATADTGMSDEEQAAFNAQIDELKRQGRDAEAIQLRQEQQAREYERTVRQQGPRTAEAYAAGKLAAERELESGLRTAGVQGYSPQQLAAIQRSGSIGASQVAGTRAAQEQARGEGALRAGLTQVSSMYPTQPTVQAAPAAQFQAAQTLAQREEDLYSGLGDTLAGVAGRLAKQTDNTSSSLYPTA